MVHIEAITEAPGRLLKLFLVLHKLHKLHILCLVSPFKKKNIYIYIYMYIYMYHVECAQIKCSKKYVYLNYNLHSI